MKAKMKGPEGHSGFSYQGTAYEPDADGHIDVPQEAIAEAVSHGFSLVAAKPAPAAGGLPNSAEIQAANLAKLSKKQLVAFGKENLGLDLDESKTAKDLIAEIEAGLDAKKGSADAGAQ